MRLKFLARNEHTVYWPGSRSTGQARQQIGKTFVAGKSPSEPARYALDKQPTEVDSDSPDAPHAIRQCQKGALWAADRETAAFCGVEFVQVALDADGDFSPAKAPAAKKPEPSKES